MSSSSYAAELVESCDDILLEIFLRIPPRRLLSLCTISRRWLSLISHPGFRRCHSSFPRRLPSSLLLRPSHFHFLLLPLSPNLFSPKHDPLLPPPFSHVLQSCNGLLLCCSRRNVGSSQDYYVFNPTTKLYSKLPVSVFYRNGVSGLTLAFDPSTSPFYKAVCVRETDAPDYSYQIEVYSSKDRELRACGSPFVPPFGLVFRDGVFWNGAVHWLSPTGTSLFFNIDSETLGEMPKPPDTTLSGSERSSKRFRYFGQSGGHLHFFEIYGSMTARFRVFEMQRDYLGWLPKFDVDLNSMIREFPETAREHHDTFGASNYYAFSVLLLVRGENSEKGSSTSVIINVPGKVLSYNVDNKAFEKIYEISAHQGNGYRKLHYGWLDTYELTETLAPV